MRLSGQVALVTGAGRGIGHAIALELAREGASVALNFHRSAEAAAAAVRDIEAEGGAALAIQADVSVREQVDALFKSARERFGGLDILVNNAGITRDKLILRMSEDDWDAVLDTNLKSAFLCCRAAAADLLRRKGGAIVNIGSVIGTVGGAGQVNYSASKAGLVGLTKSLARELGSRNIRVNAVTPGFIETDMTGGFSVEQREYVLRQTPLGRFGSATEVARTVVFLCSSDAAYIQGQIIAVDGGLFM